KRGRAMLDASRALGASRMRTFLRIDLPTLSPAILSAAMLVFVEIVKELPATLLLRPLGVETLATLIYSRANVAPSASAALPALCIVLAGTIPVILASRAGDRRKVRRCGQVRPQCILAYIYCPKAAVPPRLEEKTMNVTKPLALAATALLLATGAAWA